MVKIRFRKKYFCASRILFAAILFLLISCTIHAAPSFSASLDRDSIGLGETATLTLTFTDASPDGPPGLPTIPNLSINYAGQSSKVEAVNGAVTSSVNYTFEVTAAAVGDFVIPGFQAKVGDAVLSSQPLKLKVLPAGTATAPDEKQPAFLKLIVPKKEIYVGESVAVEIQLYCQEAQGLTMPQLQSDGFTVGTIPQPTQTQTRLGGEVYNLVIFKTSVTATKTGSLSLGPATSSLKILTGPRNIFGQYTQARPMTLRAEPQTLQVLPLPEANKPPNFNGAIGTFSMLFSASPTNVAVGDPITVKLKVTGRGSLDSLAMPAQPEWRDFKTYPATSKIDSADPLGLQGAKTFEQVVVPENSAVTQLPPFLFSFFDPNTKRYRTLTNAAIPLVVRPTAAMPQPTVFSSNSESNEQAPSRDIVHIKPQLGTIQKISAPLVRQPWFLILQGIAPLVWIGSVVCRKRREEFANNPRLRRKREVAETVSRGLKDLSRHASANDSEKFFAEMFRLLQEQIGERLNLQSAGITEAVVEENLGPMKVDPGTQSLVRQLFQACNQSRYARQRTKEELASFIPMVEKAIAGLREIK